MGEQWTWAAICRTSKLIIAWHVGKRDQESSDSLVEDVRARLVVMPQITTDGLGLYAQPIAANFGRAVPYMQTVKSFSSRPGKPGTSEKFAVERGVDFIQKRAIFGTPDPAKATNYAIERSNLTARQWNARLRRRTLAFSKKLSRHCAAVALHYVYVNLCHIPRNMRITPAMAAGITDCQFSASWGHLTAFFAGSWGHPKSRRMGPPARGRDPVFFRVMGPASEVFCSLMGPARDAEVGI
ncbi:hypothetical protein WMF11_25280 [Sorangium sp. So ce295]|uniref:hypothetical protein n=1 Tax=Sorangium sp. So ce295 TaxID=3133295 RepID=UPI003F5F20E8